MPRKNQIVIVTTALLFMCISQTTWADGPKESIAGIWRVAQEDGTTVRLIKLGDAPEVPPEVQADLDAFNASLEEAPEELRFIGVSPNGRAFGIAHYPTSEEPTGVWIWPHWRETSLIEFEEFNYFEFLSSTHVYLQFREAPHKWSVNRVAAIDDPDTLYSLPGVHWRNLRVNDDGRWSSTATETGQLITGELDPEHTDAGADDATVVPLEFEGSIDNLAWVRDGDFLVVEIVGSEEARTLQVLDADSFDVIAMEIGSMFCNMGSLVGNEHFYGIHEGEDVMYRVLPTGVLEWQARTFAENEDPASWSPSGWFTMNYKRVGVGINESTLRATVVAEPDAQLPTWPTHEVNGDEVGAGRYFWLSWE